MALVENPFQSSLEIRSKLNLVASIRTIRNYIHLLGWRKVHTQYCQIVSFDNRVKRYIFGCFCKIFKETFDDVICLDESTVEIRLVGYKNYRKPSSDVLRAVGGKIGKHKHSNVKIHLLGGISRKGLTPLVVFKGIMLSGAFQKFLSLSLMPFIKKKMPYRHRFFMDNDPKHTSGSTREFLILNSINHCETPPQSPDLMPIEMVWNDLKYHLTHKCHCVDEASLVREVKAWWNGKMNDLAYCNKKFDHIYKVIDRVVAFTGRASGL
jgi:hypothetical protein